MRIVSLLPSATEILCSLGLFDQLVGVSHECDEPARARELPVLTSSFLAHGLSPRAVDDAVAAAGLEGRPLYAVDGERLAALAPDLIVTQGVCSVCAVTPATVADGLALAPVSCAAPVLSLEAMDVEGVYRDIQRVAEATGIPERGEKLVADLRARWEKIVPVPDSPSVLMLEWPDPPWSAGHWVPEQVARAGGREAFSTAGEPSRRLDWDEVVAVDPEWIIVSACGLGVEENVRHMQDVLSSRPGLARLRAVQAKRVWAVDANGLFSRPAPRVVDGAELLADLFAGRSVSPARAQRLSL